MSIEIRNENIKYVLATHLWKISSDEPKDHDVFLGVLEENDVKIKFCVLKGGEFVNLQKGSLGEMPIDMLKAQLETGVSEKMDRDYFLLEFYENEGPVA